ncbi:helix-turn-helix domain-containing protein [Actinotalea sp. AC32]|nr:helix-turn-helix domain-containing protein [Actinotalea sp. AC32]
MVERKRQPQSSSSSNGSRPDERAPARVGPSPDGGHGGAAPRPTRHLDPSSLKAYAHPLRLQIIRHLNDHGPSTATELASVLGESTGQTSYHLRQLARHGLVEDVPERGKGRERWWRSSSIDVDAATLLEEDPGVADAARLLLTTVVQHRAAALDRWLNRGEVPVEWRQSMHTELTMQLDADELTRLNEEAQAFFEPWVRLSAQRRDDPAWADRPRVRVYYDAFPLLDD